MAALPDNDPQETNEWLDALDGVLQHEGPERAHYILEQLIEKARRSGAYLPYSANTAYINTIPPGQEERSPGDHALEHRIRSYVRWNAAAMVLRANKQSSELGGHIASFASDDALGVIDAQTTKSTGVPTGTIAARRTTAAFAIRMHPFDMA